MHAAKYSFTQEAARGADGNLARLLLFIWLLRGKRGRKCSSDYLNFLTRWLADRLISHWVFVCRKLSSQGWGEGSQSEQKIGLAVFYAVYKSKRGTHAYHCVVSSSVCQLESFCLFWSKSVKQNLSWWLPNVEGFGQIRQIWVQMSRT